jgi:hypothetical protein
MPSANRPDVNRIRDMSPREPSDQPPKLKPVDSVVSSYQPRPEPKPTAAKAMAAPWQEGDRVLAPWEPTWLRAGKIKQIKTDEAQGDQAHIAFDLDSASGWVLAASLRPLAVNQGQKARIRRYLDPKEFPNGVTAYALHTVEILEVSREDVRVGFENGYDEWTTLAALEIPCVENGPGAQPPPLAVPLKIDLNEELLKRGIRAIHAATLPPAPGEGASAGAGVPWPVIITAGVVMLLLLLRIVWRLMAG